MDDFQSPENKKIQNLLVNEAAKYDTADAFHRGKQKKLEMLISAFFNRLHDYHVQYNIVSCETLLDAQVHPEN